ncbi:signal transduction histidine kinase [Brevibacterium sanguinis]|uniref:histidine kinase n=2 Tax=Brevibacterium TaxID=1696 RepID=A0A366IP70_9MICO|nr:MULTISPECIES: histidine kinase [Brevibacterium]RBP61697.1 signal transduction histidine kinase [Brevibacterium sanguinis]RBP74322.1 signal transduction histidine kinase [Brevibacterium celere]
MRRHEWWQPAGLVACAVIVPLLVGGPWAVLLALLVVPAFLIGRRSPDLRPALIAVGTALLIQLLVAWVREPGSVLSEWIGYLLHDFVVILLPWWIGRTLQLRELRRSKEEAIIANLARTRERARIAEDMHDVLGHDLALIALHSGALELLPDAGEDQRRAAAQIRQRAVAATDRLHEILGVLRAEDSCAEVEIGQRRSPEGVGLETIVNRARESGMDVTIAATDPAPPEASAGPTCTGRTPAGPASTPPTPAEATARAIERVVQEALTNAARHAPGAPVLVALHTTEDETRLTVTNGPPDSSGKTAPPRSHGTGLIAAQERVRMLGGTLTAGPHLGGFRVEARIPSSPGRPPPVGQVDPEAEQRLRVLRRSVRTSLRRTALVPGVCAALLLGAFAVFHVLTFTSVALPSKDFAQIDIGQDRSQVTDLLPASHIPADRLPDTIEVPAEPKSSECRFYLARDSLADLGSDIYRICTADGIITVADRLTPGGQG